MRMRWLAVGVVPALLAAGPMAERTQGPLAALAHLAGCWRGPVSDSVQIEERWTAADADVMLATTRYLKGGVAVGWEFSLIRADSSGIRLTPYPDGEARPPFQLRPGEPGTAVFVNERNDFPRTIIYRGDGESGLAVRLEGEGRALEWRMAPVACGGPAPRATG